MPELPEVETLRLQLTDRIRNKKIKEVIIKDKRLIKGISAEDFKNALCGKTVKEILRRGKILILSLKPEKFLILHLRISGWLLFKGEEDKFARIIFKFSKNNWLQFCDRRVLGHIQLVDDYQKIPLIASMGEEIFNLQKEEFCQLFERKKKIKIKPLLMDQTFLAGVGNIYAQESLFCAAINPKREVSSLTKKELYKLYNCLISILKQAIQKQGSSVDSYRTITGEEGGYVPYLKVYQREGQPCLRCKSPIIRETIGGRGTYFCPKCQA